MYLCCSSVCVCACLCVTWCHWTLMRAECVTASGNSLGKSVALKPQPAHTPCLLFFSFFSLHPPLLLLLCLISPIFGFSLKISVSSSKTLFFLMSILIFFLSACPLEFRSSFLFILLPILCSFLLFSYPSLASHPSIHPPIQLSPSVLSYEAINLTLSSASILSTFHSSFSFTPPPSLFPYHSLSSPFCPPPSHLTTSSILFPSLQTSSLTILMCYETGKKIIWAG